ncbi:hypothetical protein Btru_021215 [Bulinus truncatus]|nr:hypothetical protein Btru_021215 [Bulinus truncatus]
MYTTDKLRNDFIRQIINFVRAHDVDGVKIDGQPAGGGNKEKFTQLFKELKDAIIEESSKTGKPRLILSVGIPTDKNILDKYYDLPAIAKFVDMVDLATYSFVDLGICTKTPQHHSPLYSQDPSSSRSIDFISRYVAGKGVSKGLINVGLSISSLGFYGYFSCGFWTDRQYRGYGFVCSDMVSYVFPGKYYNLDKEVGRAVSWHHNTKTTFYDDPDSFRIKMKYIIDNGYGGVIVSFVRDDDDFDECKRGMFPLLKTIRSLSSMAQNAARRFRFHDPAVDQLAGSTNASPVVIETLNYAL